MYSPPAILPLLHLTGVHMSKSTLHWSPSLNYFMVPVVGGGGGGGGDFLPKTNFLFNAKPNLALSFIAVHSHQQLKSSKQLKTNQSLVLQTV
jgi:hypothetical protein